MKLFRTGFVFPQNDNLRGLKDKILWPLLSRIGMVGVTIKVLPRIEIGLEKNSMKKIMLVLALASVAGVAQAKPAFTGKNYSGVYECKGSNDQVGDYEVKMTLRQNKISSYGTFGAYHYEIETTNGTIYRGQVAADGNRLAMSFNFSEKKNMDHSTGIAITRKNSAGRWSFRRLYYEGDDSGGVYGTEDCVLSATLQEGVETPLKNQQKPKPQQPKK